MVKTQLLPIWQPSAKRIAAANLTRFIEFINQQFHLAIESYDQLYAWSIDKNNDFWQSLWQFFDVKASQPYKYIVSNKKQMPGAKWFSGAKLNFAENLLSRQDEKIAIIYRDEQQRRRSYTYRALYDEVSCLASAMQQIGVGVGDRVAALMPNLPETVIAMLATTSLGAIWSSCSPDFGLQGILDRFGQIEPKILFAVDGYYYQGKSFDVLEKTKALTQRIPSLEKIIIVPFLQTSNISETAASLESLQSNQERSELLRRSASRNDILVIYQDFLTTKPQEISFTQLPFDHPIYIMYSSGTTGVPKCIVHGAGGVLLQHLKELVLHTDLKAEDIITYYTTCGWMMWNWVVSSLAVGATLVLYEGAATFPKHDYLFDLIAEEKINIFGTSAKYLSTIEKYHLIPAKSHDLSSLRTILSTGSPLLPEQFDFVYQAIKNDVALCSISGGTDIVSCFALGCPLLPIYPGELQCKGLGMDVAVFNEEGQAIIEQKGELVCQQPFPVMPLYFWNDPTGDKYGQAYFTKFPNVWAHGDYALITERGSMIIYGRSDAVLNPGGVRIGTAEIYRQVEKLDEIVESIVVGQEWHDDIRIILFIKLRPNLMLDETLKQKIKQMIRSQTTPRHVPAKIIAVTDIPRTFNGKIAELAVRNAIHGIPINNKEALINPDVLEEYKNLEELEN